MGWFSRKAPDRDFDVEASAPPLVQATPVPADYAAASLPAPVEARINAAATTTTTTTVTKVVSPPLVAPLGRNPTVVPACPHCGQANARTRTSTYPSWETWLTCLALVLLFWPICWLPLVMDNTKTTEHKCTSCGGIVGTVRAYQDCCVKTRG